MGIWKRACLYMTRKKGRSILLFLILSVTGLFLLAGLAVRTEASKAAAAVRTSLISGLVLERTATHWSQIYTVTKGEDGGEIVDAKVPLFTMTHLEKILKMEGVSGYFIGNSNMDYYTGLKLVPGVFSDTLKPGGWYDQLEPPKNKEEEEQLRVSKQSDLINSQAMAFEPLFEGKWEPSFLNGALEIVKGRNIERTDKGKVVISETTAETNSIDIGDTISCRNYEPISGELYGTVMKLEIVGIFRIHFKQTYNAEYKPETQIMDNIAFTDMALKEWGVREYRSFHGTANDKRIGKAAEEVDYVRIYVDDPDLLSEIREQMLAMEDVDWSFYKIEYDDTDYRAVAKPLLWIKNLFTAALALVFVGSFAILFMVLSLWIRGRKHEIGMLISIGMKKRSIMAQLVLECCMIAAAAFLAAGAASGTVTKAVGDITAELFSPSSDGEDYQMIYDGPTSTFNIHKAISDPIRFQYDVMPQTTVLVFLIMMLFAITAVVSSSAQMVGQNPKDILTGR